LFSNFTSFSAHGSHFDNESNLPTHLGAEQQDTAWKS